MHYCMDKALAFCPYDTLAGLHESAAESSRRIPELEMLVLLWWDTDC